MNYRPTVAATTAITATATITAPTSANISLSPRLFRLFALALTLWLWPCAPGAGQATAATFIVSSPADSGPGSLRAALTQANANADPANTINFSFNGPFILTSGELVISKNLTLNSSAPGQVLVQRDSAAGTPAFRIFRIHPSINVTINNLTISNGLLAGDNGSGIANAGNLTLNNCVISGNNGAVDGGGISNTGTLNLNNSTIVNNNANGGGAGLYSTGTVNGTNVTIANNSIGSGNTGNGAGLNNQSGTCTLSSATIAFNRATVGGGVFIGGGTVNVSNTIIAANADNDVAGTLTSGGFNLLGLLNNATITGDTTGNIVGVGSSEARLALPTDNGGPTPTVALYTGSPAIDAGAGNLLTDQRGQSRTGAASDGNNDGAARRDIGAFELQRYVVTTTADNGAGSLRQALTDNNAAGGGLIVFNLPGAAGSVRQFQLFSPLPAVIRPVQIDGYSQPGARPNTLATGSDAVLLVELFAANAGLDLRADNCLIRGLAVSGAAGFGIILRGANNAWIHGNHIGVGASGSETSGNRSGLEIEGNRNLIGTDADGVNDAAERNVIAGNCDFNINIAGFDNNRVSGNYIGVDAQGSNAPVSCTGSTGVLVSNTSDGDATGNLIGGSAVAARNVISGNGGAGISLQASGNTVQRNLIGLAADGVTARGNAGDGVSVNGSDNIVGDTNSSLNSLANLIANNTGAGIRVTAGTNNRLFSNALNANGGLGIDLGAAGVTANDDGDADTGANELQNFPLLTSAVTSNGGNTVVTGTLNSNASTSYTLQFFYNSACDPSGYGEGQAFISRRVLTTDASGNAAFNVTLPAVIAPGEFLTATATTNVSGRANTSEFSPCRLVESVPNSFRLLQSDYTIDETTATATLTVRRVGGGAFGAATIDYATGGGTAIGGAACGTGGTDYVSASGTLAWGANDYDDKTISITVCDDALAEANEIFNLSLANPTGGAVLGTPASATVTIFDDETLFRVTNLNDANAGSLRQAMTNANALPGDHIITFAPGVAGTINLLSGLPTLTSRVRLIGPGASVLSVARSSTQGTPAFRIFIVASGGQVAISGLTLTNGRAETTPGSDLGGGGVLLTGGALTLDNCRVVSNVAAFAGASGDAAGGGIHAAGGTLTLRQSLVAGNSAIAPNGTGRGGGLIVTNAAGNVIESTIRDNTATAQPGGFGQGGGLYVGGTASTLTLERSTVSGNSAAASLSGFGQGGGLAQINSGPVTIINSTIDGNSASGNNTDTGGGGLFLNFGRMTLSHSTITNNHATSSGTTGGSGGGLRRLSNGLLTLKNTIVALNTATRGGADVNTTSLNSQGFNLFGDTTGGAGYVASDLQNVNPQLGPLQNNGGQTFTRALLTNSPAIDAGDNNGAPATDQRGQARIVDGNADSTATIDIGAYELSATPPATGSILGRVTLAADNSSGVANVTVTLGGAASATTVTAADGAYSFPNLATGNYTVTPARAGFTFTPPSQNVGVDGDNFLLNFTATANAPAPQPANGQVLITEFRLAGTTADDEFVELYNNTDAPLALGGYHLDALAGYTVTIPTNTVLPARAHYLIAHATGYTLGGVAAADLTYNGFELPDATGLALFNPANVIVDAVGCGTTPAPYREGAPLPATGIATDATVQYSFVRKLTTGLPQDTGDNAADFILVSTAGAPVNNAPASLGAPGPENASAPVQRNAQIKATLIDSQCGGTSTDPTTACARVRETTPVANGQFGTLSIRRKFSNNTGAPISVLRFRIVDLTTLGNRATGEADMRALNSVATSVTLTSGAQVPLSAITLEEPPAQTSGGGMNATLRTGSITLGTPLGNGMSVNVQFRLGIQQTGSFRFYFNVEAAP